MSYAVSTPAQLRTVLRALRESRKLSQAELGKRIGVSQRRIAAIEAAPARASFDQLTRLIAALGARVVIDVSPAAVPTATVKKSAKRALSEKGDW
jgi:HTH-type transcriptional regulator/antitoxin HipB